VLISLVPTNQVSTWNYIKTFAPPPANRFPSGTFSFGSADIVSQILNFGIPAPIDVQVVGRDSGNYALAQRLADEMRRCRGRWTSGCNRLIAAPELSFDVDRTRAALLGLTQQNVATSVLTSLSSTVQAAPTIG